MSQPFTTLDDVLAPILPDWTIRDLLEWLSDDTRIEEDSVRGPLAIIEGALTGSPWTREPSTVALIRSIASAVQASPRLRNMRLDDLLPRTRWIRDAPPAEEPAAFSIRAAEAGREREPQVA